MISEGVSYCERWNFDYQESIDPLPPEQALALDVAGDFYTVVLADPTGGDVPEAVIEIAWKNNVASVWFFDEFGRQSLNYVFRRTDDDRLFLHNMIEYEYPDEHAETLIGATRTDEIRFEPDGMTKQIISDDIKQERETIERSDVDVSSHWEPVPKFGEWDSLARWNRDGEEEE
ncbi:hypothetical protein [Allorhizocola rhizosphaerae]|uniref:hypothetical protein n=1 Tax=Allorhizocola rhizosphaerae TaxID=1872709 RepID=UPI0013C371E8|nr:hypothetical protein [Allorhizocola rhizosphaerae]